MRDVFRTTQLWAIALVPVLTAGPALAQSVTANPGAQQAPPADRYVVGQARPPAEPGLPVVDMTLEDAMVRALENNLDLQVARMNPPAVDYQLRAARAAFNPTFTSRYRYQNASRPNNSTLEAGGISITDTTQNYDVGASQTLPWLGTSMSVNFNNSRVLSNSTQIRFNPNIQSSFAFTATQPLLQGFRIDNSRNALRTLAIQRQVSDVQLLASIENTKASVRQAYWNLRQAIEQIEIQRRALELAQRLYEDNRIKVEIGTLAPIDTVQPEAAVATAEQALLNAEIAWRTADLNLKRLLANGPDDSIYQAIINPTELPTLAVQSVDIPAAVRNALSSRTDLVVTRRNLEVSRLNLELTADQVKPSLNLQAGYNASGQGRRIVDGTEVLGTYSDAFNQVFRFDQPTWNIQFNLNYPLFMAAAKANLARARLQFQQSEASIKAQELTVSAEVTNAGLAVENTFKQYQAAVKAREAQERNAEAEQTRFDVGMSTNYNVVQAQNNLTSARLTELSRLIAYLNAIAEFDRVQRVGGR